MKKRLKKSVVYVLYTLSFVLIMGAIYLIDSSSKPKLEEDVTYVNDVILEDTYPVVNVKEVAIKPFLDDSVVIKRGFYNSAKTEEEQKSALIYYQGTYIPSSGIDYKGNDVFDVVAMMEGTVSKVTDNNLLGKIVEISHNNNLISVYQSLGEVMVSEGEPIIQGQIIGKSGEANISTDLGNHLHFEVISKGVNVDPESCYGKSIEEF